MNRHAGKHITVHINELVLPRGTRTPDQAALRRMVESAVQAHLGANGAGPEAARAPVRGAATDQQIGSATATQVCRHLDGSR